MMDGLFIGVYRVGDWIVKLAFINVLWIIFTVVGFGVFGIFPATAASFALFRKWFLGDKDFPISKTFLEYYKQNFKTANILGFILTILGLFLYFDFKFFQNAISHPVFGLISAVFFILIFLYFIALLNIFPIFVHFDFKLLDYLKYSLILAIGRPFQTVRMILGFIVVFLLFNYLPFLIPFFGSSLLCGVLMWISCLAFPKQNLGVQETNDFH